MRPLRWGMIGGGEGAFIGAVHRMAARLDGRYQLVAGVFSSDAEKTKRSALMLQRGQFLDSGGGRIAYVLDGKGLAHRRPITVGARSLSAVQIESGLEEGDSVVISSIEPFEGAETVLVTD
jgi:multidrug efflux pump subunit AcrA (membrane-fusion protein)